MIIIQTLGGIGSSYGGPSVSVPRLCHAIAEVGSTEVTLLIPAETGDPPVDELKKGYRIKTFSYLGPDRLRITPGLVGTADRLLLTGNSIVHCHGLWMYPQWALGRLAIRKGIPLVISPRGMLQKWALTQSGCSKHLLAQTFLRQHVERVSLYHALSRQEVTEIREFGVRCPVAVVPNGVDIRSPATAEAVEVFRSRFPTLRAHRVCLFLSRLHPKKNLEGLLDAWALLFSGSKLEDWHLAIAGVGTDDYVKTLRKRVASLDMGSRVTFLGGVYGTEKEALLAAADLFVLPSFSEGFSMAVLEAAASGLPVVMTEGCNFPELVEAGGAVIASTSAEAIANSLNDVMGRSEGLLMEMGAAGAALVRTRYSWEVVGRSMVEVYRWLLDGGTTPASVVT